MLRKQFLNCLPKLRVSAGVGESILPYVKVGVSKITNPVTLKVVNIPRYAIEKKCYNIHLGDELNSLGKRKSVREITDFGKEYLQYQFETRVKTTTQRFYDYSESLKLGYNKQECYVMSVYNILYSGMLASTYRNLESMLHPGQSMFDYDIVCSIYRHQRFDDGNSLDLSFVKKKSISLFTNIIFPDLAEATENLSHAIDVVKSGLYDVNIDQ